MQVGSFSSLAEMVANTPKFGDSELKTFKDAARSIIDNAESVVLSNNSPGAASAQRSIQDMRDLQCAMRAGYPIERRGTSNYIINRLPRDLYETMAKVNAAMPLFMTLTMMGPTALAQSTVVVPAGSSTITVKAESPAEQAIEQLESIRNDIADSIADVPQN